MLKLDGRLQQCLVSDRAHVTPGSVGSHVAKIQMALMALDEARIDLSELHGKRYGISTTAAVLAYKQKRKIINRAYQTQADNIVGKMTVASLDKDLIALDRRPPNTAFCGHGTSAAAAATRFGLRETAPGPGAPGSKTHFNKQFRILFQITELGDAFGGYNMLDDLWRRAEVLMLPFRLEFVNKRPPKGKVLPHDGIVDVHFSSDKFAIRRLSLNADPGFEKTLRVIFCPFAQANPYFGITCGGPNNDGDPVVEKFVLINTNIRQKDSGTLLHEMIHAATPGVSDSRDHDEKHARCVFSTSDDGRDELRDEYAVRLSNAYFA
ncbi:hypothetical protein WDZ92_23950 [Nostoc sp. NIES-2111]